MKPTPTHTPGAVGRPARRFILLASFLALVPALSAAITPLAHYRAGESPDAAVAGQTVSAPVRDSTANALHLTAAVNAAWSSPGAPSTNSSSFAFGGAGWFIYRAGPVTTLNDRVGLEAWVRSEVASQNAIILHNGKSGGAGGTDGFGLYQSGPNWVGHLAGVAFLGSVPVTPGKWTHLAIVSDWHAWGGTRFYVDGEVRGFVAGLGAVPSSAFSLGADVITPGGSQFFNGSLDEVRVFTFAPGAFSPADLLHAQTPGPLPDSLLTVRYEFGEDDPGALADATMILDPREHAQSRFNLIRHGNPAYSAASAWPGPGSLAGSFAGNSMLYRAAPLATATDNFALGLSVRAASLSTGGADRVVAWNGTPSVNGYGIVQRDARFLFRVGSTDVAETPASTTWSHLALWRDQGTLRASRDGAPLPALAAVPATPTGCFTLAGDPVIPGGGAYFSGLIDSLRFTVFAPGAFDRADLIPAQDSRTGRASVRFEARPGSLLDPLGDGGTDGDVSARQAYNTALAANGVDSVTLGVQDGLGRALWDTAPGGAPALPPGPDGADLVASTQLLRDWVNEVKAGGQNAIAWSMLFASASGYATQPDWRVKRLDGLDWGDGLSVCFNTGFGDALINMLRLGVRPQSEGGLGLDGYWLDGVWVAGFYAVDESRESLMACACSACRRKFGDETGYPFPVALDWSDARVRLWLDWRYRTLTDYLRRLERAVREVKPDASLLFNHNNRPDISWASAAPLQRWPGNIIPASESVGDLDESEFKTRVVRAQRTPQVEMWRHIETSAERSIRHLLTFAQNGAVPYPASPWNTGGVPAALGEMQGPLKAVRPWIRSTPAPYAGLLLSRNTATHFYGRPQDGSIGKIADGDRFWRPLQAWMRGLAERQIAPDLIHETDLGGAEMSRYRVLFAPQSICLSDAYAERLRVWVRDGGVLVLGPGAGECDATGAEDGLSALNEYFGYNYSALPSRDGSANSRAAAPHLIARVGATGTRAAIAGEFVNVGLDANWTIHWQLSDIDNRPVIASRAYGSGKVYAVALSPAHRDDDALRLEADGQTLCAVSADRGAGGGARSVKMVDSPFASSVAYPHLGRTYPAIRKSDGYTGAIFECDVFIPTGSNATVTIGQRHTPQAPNFGPALVIQGGGNMYANGVQLLRFGSDLTPMNQWMRVRIDYTFAADDTTGATYTATVTTPTQTFTASSSSGANGFARSNWSVIYSDGDSGSFYVDNLRLWRKTPSGTEAVYSHDFEAGADAIGEPARLAGLVAEQVLADRTPPVRVVVGGGDPALSAQVRSEVFDAGQGRYLVHLFHRAGRLADWGSAATGPSVVLQCDFSVASARRILAPAALAPVTTAGQSTLSVGNVGFYEIIELQRADRIDTDRDGIPDAAEPSLGLDANNPDDAQRDADGDGRSALAAYEESLNGFPAPSALAAEVLGATSVRLAWQDNSADETAFSVERRRAGESFLEVARLAAEATAWTDPGLAPGTRYDYRVRALAATGASAYAGPVSATTWSAFRAWLASSFPAAQLPATDSAAASVDPDGDGISNLLEYAFGGDPARPDTAILPTLTQEAGALQLTYRVDPFLAGVRYLPERTTDLRSTWSPDGITLEDLPAENGFILRRARVALPATGSVFLRLRVTLP